MMPFWNAEETFPSIISSGHEQNQPPKRCENEKSHTDPGFMNHQGNGHVSCFAIIQKAEESLYGLRGIIFAEQMYTHTFLKNLNR